MIASLFLTAALAASPDGGTLEVVTFEGDAGTSALEAMVGDWRPADLGGQHGWLVDGSKWRQGTPSANLADHAKRLYGERYAEFLDGVKAFAFFPLSVWSGDCTGDDVTLSVRFFPEAGRIDQAAGLAFDVKPDGSYLGARANALEDNLLFFRVVKGKRSIIDHVRGVTTTSRQWHTLVLERHKLALKVILDGEVRLEKQLDAAPTGRCGLWSKADSVVLFDDFTVTGR